MDDRIQRRDFLKRVSRLAALGATTLRTAPFATALGQGALVRSRTRRRAATFRMLVVGDSVAWGQGLSEEQKYYTKVERWLAGQLSGGPTIDLKVYAHSGAIIASDPARDTNFWYGREVPEDYPSITRQLTLARSQLPAEEVDLILLNGGINDVNVRNILTVDPTIGDKPMQIRTWVQERMRPGIQSLLMRVLEDFPAARIVVTNYYPIISRESPLPEVATFIGVLGVIGGGVVGAVASGAALGGVLGGAAGVALSERQRDDLGDQCFAFDDEATKVLRAAVAEANEALRGADKPARVALAESGFGMENAYATPLTYLFRAGDDDPVKAERKLQCEQRGKGLDLQCLNASMGHPNAKGAQRYADRIVEQLRLLIPECAA